MTSYGILDFVHDVGHGEILIVIGSNGIMGYFKTKIFSILKPHGIRRINQGFI